MSTLTDNAVPLNAEMSAMIRTAVKGQMEQVAQGLQETNDDAETLQLARELTLCADVLADLRLDRFEPRPESLTLLRECEADYGGMVDYIREDGNQESTEVAQARFVLLRFFRRVIEGSAGKGVEGGEA